MPCAGMPLLPRLVIGLAAIVSIASSAGQARAQGVRPPISEPYLFYNFYVPPNAVDGVGAALYPAPRTTIPPYVGHTYITYQALEPHQFLYCHHRNYYRYHPGSGWTKARVCWW